MRKRMLDSNKKNYKKNKKEEKFESILILKKKEMD
jgi:hypothetical protein